MKKIRFGVIDTWPWGVKNAESEVINRMKVAAENIGAELICVTKEGFLVDEHFQRTDERIDPSALDFILSMHYEDIKMQDAFHYHVLWNPPKITLQYDLYHLYAKNIASHDDYLIYDDGGMSNHLKTLLSDHPRDLSDASSLTASFSKTAAIEPQIPENPVLFYCGVNWERFISGAESRHSGLFALLDKQEDVNLYGPEHSWDGYRRYRGSIPFDGTSLINEIHQCGVVLALSSDYHYRAGAATNRIYEACAGGAITISDTNRFIKNHFGDSVLYIAYDKKHPDKMFTQIRMHLDWIKQHPDQAFEKAQKAQQIFLEKFSLEKQLLDIISNHSKRKEAVKQAMYARDAKGQTLLVLFLDTDILTSNELAILNNAIHNAEIQRNSNVVLAVCCDKGVESELKKYIENSSVSVNLIGVNFFDDFSNKTLSRGEAFAQVIKQIPHQYFMLLDGSEIMFSTHVTTLVRTLEDHAQSIAAYAGDFLDALDGMRYPHLREVIRQFDFYNGYYPSRYPHPAGMFLFRAEAAELLPAEAEPFLDECLPNALLNLAIFSHQLPVKYSGFMTVGKKQSINIDFQKVMTNPMQINFVQGLVQTGYEEWLASCPASIAVSSEIGSHEFREVDKHLFKMMRRKFRKRLVIEIMWNCIRLMANNKDGRARIRRKIEKLKHEYSQTK